MDKQSTPRNVGAINTLANPAARVRELPKTSTNNPLNAPSVGAVRGGATIDDAYDLERVIEIGPTSPTSPTDQAVFAVLANPKKVDLSRANPIPKNALLPSRNSIRGEKKAEMSNPRSKEIPLQLQIYQRPKNDLSKRPAPKLGGNIGDPNYKSPFDNGPSTVPYKPFEKPVQNIPTNNNGTTTTVNKQTGLLDFDLPNFDFLDSSTVTPKSYKSPFEETSSSNQPTSTPSAGSTNGPNNLVDSSFLSQHLDANMPRPGEFLPTSVATPSGQVNATSILSTTSPMPIDITTPITNIGTPALTTTDTSNSFLNDLNFASIFSPSAPSGGSSSSGVAAESTSKFSEAVDNVLKESESIYKQTPTHTTATTATNNSNSQQQLQIPLTATLLDSTIFGNNGGGLGGHGPTGSRLLLDEEREEENREKQSYLLELDKLKQLNRKPTREYSMADSVSDIKYEVERLNINTQTVEGITTIKTYLKVFGTLVDIGNKQLDFGKGPILDLDGFVDKWSETVDTQNTAIEGIHRKYCKRGTGSSPEMSLIFAFLGALVMTHAKNKYGYMLFGAGPPGAADNSNNDNNSNSSGPTSCVKKKKKEKNGIPPLHPINREPPFSRVPGAYNPYMNTPYPGNYYPSPPQYYPDLSQGYNQGQSFYPMPGQMPPYNNDFGNMYSPNPVPPYYDPRFRNDPYGMSPMYGQTGGNMMTYPQGGTSYMNNQVYQNFVRESQPLSPNPVRATVPNQQPSSQQPNSPVNSSQSSPTVNSDGKKLRRIVPMKP